MKQKIITAVFSILILTNIVILFNVFEIIKLFDGANKVDPSILDQSMQKIYVIIILMIASLVILYFALSKILKDIILPLNQLSQDANEFATNNYVHHLRSYNIKEVQTLANSFDNMGEQMNNAIRKLKYQKAKVESLLLKLEEGIIILTPEGHINEINNYAKEILKVKEIQLKKEHINNILRDNKSVTFINQALSQKEDKDYEIIISDKILYITITPVLYKDKVLQHLLIIRDITKIRKLEEMRYQFVSNVTHELKTPLTSIQGFVETLKEGAINDKEVALRFLDIIDIETKRLNMLIQDILFLSEIENATQRKLEQTEVTKIIKEVISLLEKQAVAKNIDLNFENKDDLTLENTNSNDIKQLIINLVSNAIKYTDQGEILISTEMTEEGKMIKVKDTGIGIPHESIPHIFERFYRVDKSRSRKSGGTGLGLSIVKHIVSLYGGTISVESEEGKGSTFIVLFRS